MANFCLKIIFETENFSLDFKAKNFCFIVRPNHDSFYSQIFEWEKINHLPNCSGDKKWFCILYITSSTTKVFFSGPFVKVGTNWVLCTPFQNSSFGTNQKAWEKLWQKLLPESRKPTFVFKRSVPMCSSTKRIF